MKTILGILVVVVLIGGGYWYWQSTQSGAAMSDDGTSLATDAVDDLSNAPAPDDAATLPDASSTAQSGAAMSATVSYDGSSFTPSELTIKKGGTVTYTGPAGMWVASAPHPAHSGYDGTDRSTHCAASYTGPKPFDQCKSGTSYTFTFDKVGAWPYHDHKNPSAFGKITVVE